MKTEHEKRVVRFADLGLSQDLTKVLTGLKFVTPTPIQEQAIPLALEGQDVIGIAQTGTGKTLSFFLPMLQQIDRHNGIGLIVVPTRELAHQVQVEIDRVGNRLGFKTALLIGGANMDRQMRDIARKPDVIVATPGRLIDHLERRTIRLERVRVLVLDEADRMLDMGFAPQINQILKSVPTERQTFLFSATMPDAITNISHRYMKNPVRVEVAPPGTRSETIEQGAYFVDVANKFYLLKDMLRAYKQGPVLVFCRTKHGAKKMAHTLNREGFRSEELHANRTLNQRRRALENFKSGKSPVLVATDVASRGIDVKEIALVVNYDLPDQPDDYVHRIGRTGRAGHTGRAVSFVLPDQYRDFKAIERLMKEEIPILEAPGTMTEAQVMELATRYSPSRSKGGGRPFGGRGRGGRGGGGGGRSRVRSGAGGQGRPYRRGGPGGR